MSTLSRAQISERKAQLVARAALERMRLTLAMAAVRQQVMPPPGREPLLRRPLVSILVAFALKRVGAGKLRRWVRVLSYATMAYRIVTNLRR
jgi:hypothetical protein